MRKAWVAAMLSLVTVVGGHLYNRRPYTAILFIFAVIALQSLVNGLVPMLMPQLEAASSGSAFRLMAWSNGAFLLAVAVTSAFCAFSDARSERVAEGSNLKTVASIAGVLVGLRLVSATITAAITVLRFG